MNSIFGITGAKCLLGESFLALAASTTLFSNAPAETRMIRVTVRGGGVLTMRFDGEVATLTDGHDFGPGTYELAISRFESLKVRAIGPDITGYVSYFGVA